MPKVFLQNLSLLFVKIFIVSISFNVICGDEDKLSTFYFNRKQEESEVTAEIPKQASGMMIGEHCWPSHPELCKEPRARLQWDFFSRIVIPPAPMGILPLISKEATTMGGLHRLDTFRKAPFPMSH